MVHRSCSRVLSVLPPSMQVDMALPLYLTKEEFRYRTGDACVPPLSSCLRFQHSSCVDQLKSEGDRPPREDDGRAKKRVTFADHRGLPLTRVKVFSQFSDPIDIPLNVQRMLTSALTAAAAATENRLVLGFAQPSSDYLSFRQRLERNSVSLEHCVLRETVLAGTVKVKNLSFEKSVRLRVTFDSWKSHRDVACSYVKDAYPGSHSDTFSFQVRLPAVPRPYENVEFAVCYEAQGREHWDNNQGSNYRILWRRDQDVGGRCHRDFGIHFDRYGSPTCSHGIFPDWPSYAEHENTGPYY